MKTNEIPLELQARSGVILISGAAGGLGKAFAVECASRGWDMLITDMHLDALELLAVNLRRTYGVRVFTYACDLTDPAERAGLFERIERDHLRLCGLINVAGVDFEGPFFEQSSAQIRTILRLNIEGTLDMIHGALPLHDPAQTFRIINVASLAGFCPMPQKATYAASKRFLLDFSLALRSELSEMGMTVTALCPAGMPTNRECIESIDSQGLMGQLTTQNTGTVVNQTLNAALKGKAVCIPGRVNQLLQLAGSFVPTSLAVYLIGQRWKATRQKRFAQDAPAAEVVG